MRFSSTLFSLVLVNLLIIMDYRGGEPATKIGNVELEGQDLGCKIKAGRAGNAAFIRPEMDETTGRQSLHFKRDPHFRRAEARGEEGKPGNFPMAGDLTIEYTIPGSNGSNRDVVWTGPLDISKPSNKLASVINTSRNGKGWLEFYVNGQKQTFNKKWGGEQRLKNVHLFTGPTSPKIGIYRAEASGGGVKFCPSNGIYLGGQARKGSDRVYNSWVYRYQISDSSLDEIKQSSRI
ncbi:hypothetical protein BDZ91DRAFT_783218 [Kalaharituber pfeilii]|nr:hypothetical protein BDZ91DRAFT_783218 [Kalaharituber pfeilii]